VGGELHQRLAIILDISQLNFNLKICILRISFSSARQRLSIKKSLKNPLLHEICYLLFGAFFVK